LGGKVAAEKAVILLAKKKEEKAEKKQGKGSHKAEKEKARGKKAEKKDSQRAEKARGKKAVEKRGGKAKKVEKRGKSREKPMKEKKPGVPDWVELKPEEAVEAIVNLGNAGHSSSEIGMLLRDQYGVPNVKALTGKSVEEIMADHKLLPEIPSDLMSLIKKSVNLQKHLKKNKKDFSAKRGLQLTVSKIRNLVKYYKRKGRLPLDWRYSEKTASLLVK